jgi:hypothetical protein
MENDLDLIRLAAMTAGSLKQVDNDMVQRSSSAGPAARIDPKNFIKKPIQPAVQQPKYNLVPDSVFVEKPVSRPMGSDVQGTINVDVNSLLIPMPAELEKFQQNNRDLQAIIPPEPQVTDIRQVETKPKESIPITLDEKLARLEKKMNKVIRMLSKNGK